MDEMDAVQSEEVSAKQTDHSIDEEANPIASGSNASGLPPLAFPHGSKLSGVMAAFHPFLPSASVAAFVPLQTSALLKDDRVSARVIYVKLARSPSLIEWPFVHRRICSGRDR